MTTHKIDRTQQVVREPGCVTRVVSYKGTARLWDTGNGETALDNLIGTFDTDIRFSQKWIPLERGLFVTVDENPERHYVFGLPEGDLMPHPAVEIDVETET